MNSEISPKGILHLIPTPLGESAPLEVLPLSIKKVVEDLTHFIVENEKMARRFIKKISPNKNQDELVLFPLNKFTSQEEINSYLDPCLEGTSMGLLSDAGCPGIADPGAVIVSMAHRNDILVKPQIGPSSIVLAMMSSGMNGQNFAFNGYLPIDKKQRSQSLLKYQRIAVKENQAQIFIETPYRSDALFAQLLKVLDPNTKLCIACDLSLDSEYIKTYSVLKWKKNKPQLQKRPCIFIFEGSF
jgi:16S rRNA (cytidine1402-2'-O)-methyltransferase